MPTNRHTIEIAELAARLAHRAGQLDDPNALPAGAMSAACVADDCARLHRAAHRVALDACNGTDNPRRLARLQSDAALVADRLRPLLLRIARISGDPRGPVLALTAAPMALALERPTHYTTDDGEQLAGWSIPLEA